MSSSPHSPVRNELSDFSRDPGSPLSDMLSSTTPPPSPGAADEGLEPPLSVSSLYLSASPSTSEPDVDEGSPSTNEPDVDEDASTSWTNLSLAPGVVGLLDSVDAELTAASFTHAAPSEKELAACATRLLHCSSQLREARASLEEAWISLRAKRAHGVLKGLFADLQTRIQENIATSVSDALKAALEGHSVKPSRPATTQKKKRTGYERNRKRTRAASGKSPRTPSSSTSCSSSSSSSSSSPSPVVPDLFCDETLDSD